MISYINDNINQKTFQLDISFSLKSLKSIKHYAKMYLNKSAKQIPKGEQLYESFL